MARQEGLARGEEVVLWRSVANGHKGPWRERKPPNTAFGEAESQTFTPSAALAESEERRREYREEALARFGESEARVRELEEQTRRYRGALEGIAARGMADDPAKLIARQALSTSPASKPRDKEEAMNGIELIRAERERQVSEEGWTPEHDDAHDEGEIARAAACYADPDRRMQTFHHPSGGDRGDRGGSQEFPYAWPWEVEWWKPKDRLTDLVRAGALIAAEIDRLQRGEAVAGDRGEKSRSEEKDWQIPPSVVEKQKASPQPSSCPSCGSDDPERCTLGPHNHRIPGMGPRFTAKWSKTFCCSNSFHDPVPVHGRPSEDRGKVSEG